MSSPATDRATSVPELPPSFLSASRWKEALVTPTLKVRRCAIQSKHEKLEDRLYAADDSR